MMYILKSLHPSLFYYIIYYVKIALLSVKSLTIKLLRNEAGHWHYLD